MQPDGDDVQWLAMRYVLGELSDEQAETFEAAMSEDVALCEFVCTSKNPIQQILRQGLETVKEQS